MSSIPANRQSRRRTARRTTAATLAWLRGNGVALTVLAGLLLIGSLALTQSGVAVLAFARFGDAFNQVANINLPNLLAASRLSELSQSLVARAPELAAAGSQTQRQGIADRLNERLAALAQVLDRIDRTAINSGQLQNHQSVTRRSSIFRRLRPKQTDLVPGKGQFRSRFPQSAQLRLSDNDFSGSPQSTFGNPPSERSRPHRNNQAQPFPARPSRSVALR